MAGYKRSMQDLKGASNKNNSLYHEVVSESVDKYWADLANQDTLLLQQEGRITALLDNIA